MTKAQKAKLLKELSDKIAVRNYVQSLVVGPKTTLTADKKNWEALRQFVSEVDRDVVETILKDIRPSAEPVQVSKQEAFREADAVKKVKTKTKPNAENKKGAARKGVVQRVFE